MNRIKSALAGLLVIAGIAPAFSQVANYPQTLPPNTVVGRTGVSSGPSQAIPFAIFNQSILSSLCQTTNAMPVYSGGKWSCTPSQTANTVLAGPSTGAAAQGAYRALVGADLPLPAASTLGGVMSKAAAASNWLRSIGTDGIPTASQPSFADISGVATGAQLPNPAAGTLGGVKSLAAVSHQFLTAISTAGQPTQAQPACTDLSDATSCNAARGQLPGESSTGSASAGNVGEYIVSDIPSGSAVGLTSTTNANLTSISLTAGDWDVTFAPTFSGGATTTVSFIVASISTTSATPDATLGRSNNQFYNNATVFNNLNPSQPIPPRRFSLSGTTTIFAVVRANFAVSTCSAFGTFSARRAR